MKLDCLGMKRHERALTFVEVVVVIAVIVLFGALLLPALNKAKRPKGKPIDCGSKLKEIGLGLRLFSEDHAGKLPWLVPTAEGGSMEYAGSTEIYRHFLAISNWINNPKVLVCPGDTERTRRTEWANLSNKNLSYFVGLEARGSQPSSILAGDRTITIDKKAVAGLVTLNTNSSLRILNGLHGDFVNLLAVDGSVRRLYDKSAKNWVLYSNQLPMRWAVP